MYEKKTTSGRMLDKCYIICKIDPMYCTMIWELGGLRGFKGGSPREFFFPIFGGLLLLFLVVF
jgi:hypothetical protein